MKKIFLFTLLFLTAVFSARAQNPADSGAILDKQKSFSLGYKDESSQGTLTTFFPSGTSTASAFEIKLLESTVQTPDMSVIRFTAPETVKGISLLSHGAYEGTGQQWLYLPAFKALKRIEGKSLSDSFSGSAFSYEDLMPLQFGNHEFQIMGERACGNSKCLIMMATTKDGIVSTYSKKILLINKDQNQTVQVDFFDRQGQLIKQCTLENYQLINGKFFRAGKITMRDLRSQLTSVLELKEVKIGTGLTADLFAPQNLAQQ